MLKPAKVAAQAGCRRRRRTGVLRTSSSPGKHIVRRISKMLLVPSPAGSSGGYLCREVNWRYIQSRQRRLAWRPALLTISPPAPAVSTSIRGARRLSLCGVARRRRALRGAPARQQNRPASKGGDLFGAAPAWRLSKYGDRWRHGVHCGGENSNVARQRKNILESVKNHLIKANKGRKMATKLKP